MNIRLLFFVVAILLAVLPMGSLAEPSDIDGESVRAEFAAKMAASTGPAEIGVPVIPEKDEDLVEFAKFLAIADPDIIRIRLDDEISLTHREQAKILGFIPVQYDVTVSARPDDLVLRVQAPWWIGLSSHSVGTIQRAGEDALTALRDAATPENTERESLLRRQKVVMALLMPWRKQL